MTDGTTTLQNFYRAVVARDLAAARAFLSDKMVFQGLFETYNGPDEYLKALGGLLSVTKRLHVQKVVTEGPDTVVLFELETTPPVEATTLVTEWCQVTDGKISHVRSVFDGRPFAAMFAPDAAEVNKKTIREFTRTFKNEHNVDGVGHLFDKDFVHHFRSPMAAGFEGLRQVGIMMNGAFPDVVVTEKDLVAGGDKVVERSAAVATHKGSMMGERPTGKRVEWSEIHIYRMREGRVVEHWAEIAMMELLQQIGVLPGIG